MTTRLNKHIAETGFCSRREADRLIGERRVTVNGVIAGTGTVVGEDDTVLVDGQPLRVREAKSLVRAATCTSHSTSRWASPAPPRVR